MTQITQKRGSEVGESGHEYVFIFSGPAHGRILSSDTIENLSTPCREFSQSVFGNRPKHLNVTTGPL
ncbi:hypothetical protein [Streptomyces alkaliterrae]|uniref:hypothetical protein n=1 Tax=Streptomyces alkaliterrae TaxID=2213162 RepID=UPI0015632A1F|nr:hypothetical protein [Streptomyces alkaliterrae]